MFLVLFIDVGCLKVPKFEIFDLLNFCYLYITKTLWVGDLETILKIIVKNILGFIQRRKVSTRMLSLILKTNLF